MARAVTLQLPCRPQRLSGDSTAPAALGWLRAGLSAALLRCRLCSGTGPSAADVFGQVRACASAPYGPKPSRASCWLHLVPTDTLAKSRLIVYFGRCRYGTGV